MFSLLYSINNHKCVQELEISECINEAGLEYFKGKAILIDGTVLHIREVVTPNENKYSYHWQSSNGKFLRRWDNAPHWLKIETFPHHTHIGNEKNIESSIQVTIIDVLDFILGQIK